VLVLTLAGLLVITVGWFAGTRLGRSTRSPAAPAEATADQLLDPALALPLDPAAAGFVDGAGQELGIAEGPAAVSYCRHAPAVTGLQAWRGSRLTEAGGQRRVIQVVSRFQSPQQAATYLTAVATLVDCQSWQSDDPPIRFTVAQAAPVTTFGDETKRFDLQATADSSRYFLRSLLFRVGRQVVQLTYVSVDRADLDNLDALAGRAAQAVSP
jgi:hypothetical protein